MIYKVSTDKREYELDSFDKLFKFITRHNDFRVDPTTIFVFYDYSPHPAGWAAVKLNFRIIDKGNYLIFPYSKPLKRSLTMRLKDGIIRRYDNCAVRTVTRVQSDAKPLTTWTKLLDPYSLVDYAETVEVSMARLSHEKQKLESYRRYRELYPKAPLYPYNLLCQTRMAHIKELMERLK